jgi:hypothetical protein
MQNKIRGTNEKKFLPANADHTENRAKKNTVTGKIKHGHKKAEPALLLKQTRQFTVYTTKYSTYT